MNKYIKWRDRSYPTSGSKWVPEAIVDVIEEAHGLSQPVYLSDADHEKIKQGDLTFCTAEAAKVAAYELVRRAAWKQWGIPEVKIQEF